MPTLLIRFDTTIPNGRDLFYDFSISNSSIGYCDRHLYEGDHLWINKFQINQEHRSENCPIHPNYGKRFMELYYVYAHNHGCRHVDCEPNEDAERFWINIGFQYIGEMQRRGTYPPEGTFRIFRKQI